MNSQGAGKPVIRKRHPGRLYLAGSLMSPILASMADGAQDADSSLLIQPLFVLHGMTAATPEN